MVRGLTLTTALFLAAFEPLPAVAVTDPIERALTQGGLFGVVLVLLWYIRSLHAQRIEERDRITKERLAEKEQQLTEKDEKIQILVDLVSETKVSVSKNADALVLQAQSLASLTRAIEKIDERRAPR